MMKERFAKLLLGEDMSGSGKGVSTALAVSNAITNLSGISTLLSLCLFCLLFLLWAQVILYIAKIIGYRLTYNA